MRKADVSLVRQPYLVRCEGHPNCFALIPPATPRTLLASATTTSQLQRAHEALGTLRAVNASLPNIDLITRTLARHEAVQSSQIEGVKTIRKQGLLSSAFGANLQGLAV